MATDLKTRAVDPLVKQALASAEIVEDGGSFYLTIKEPLSRTLYQEADKVLKRLGGQWVRGKGTKFAVDPHAAIGSILADGRYVDLRDHGFFPTPDEIVEKLVEWADVRYGMRCLEPSAGMGAIASLLAHIVGIENVRCGELLPECRKHLIEQGYRVDGNPDFLTWKEPAPYDSTSLHDRVVMNPPFANLADVDHVQHAFQFVKPGGRLVAVTSPSWTFRQERKAQQFKVIVQRFNAWPKIDGRPVDALPFESLPEGTFKEAGTDVRTVVVVLDKPL